MHNKAPIVFRFLRECLLPQWRACITAGLLIILSVLLQFVFPLLAKDVIDQVADQKGPSNLSLLIGILICAMIVTALVSFGNESLSLRIREKIIFSLEKRVLEHLHRLPLSFFTKQHSTYLQSRVMSDARAVEGLLIRSLLTMIISGMTFLIGATLVFSFRWEMGLSLLLIVVPYTFIRYHGNEKMRHYSMRMQEQQASASQCIAESFAGIRTTKAFGRESEQNEMLAASLEQLHNIYFETNRLGIVTSVGVTLVAGLGSAIVLGLGAWFIANGEMTVGDIFAVLILVSMTYSPVNSLISTNLSMQKAAISIERVYELLDIPEERKMGDNVETLTGSVDLRNIDFSYEEGMPVLTQINLSIPKGKKIALVGKTGAGKSTLLNLLLGFYQPDSGEILFDGRDARTISLKSLRRHIGIVDQQSMLFTGTIADNIRFGKPGATREEIESAARNAFVDDFIEKMPARYETVVGERGALLSGGQVQRVMLARMFLKNPSILILDEALAAVDSNSEALIQEALTRLLKGRTAILIAHRLSSLITADHVVVLDGGTIVEEGRHDELFSLGGHYMTLFNHQFDVKSELTKQEPQFAEQTR